MADHFRTDPDQFVLQARQRPLFQVGYSLIAASGTVGTSTGDPPAHFFKPPQARPAMAIDTKIANNRITPKTTLSALDGYTMRWPSLSGGRVDWPKGVPRIATLDETRKSDSRAANRRFSHPSLISIPLMPNKEVPNKSTSPWGVQLAGSPRSRLSPLTAHCKRSTKPSLAPPPSRGALLRSGHASVSKRKPAKLRRRFALGYARPVKLALYSATERVGSMPSEAGNYSGRLDTVGCAVARAVTRINPEIGNQTTVLTT